jgi:hypothetical protein
MRDDKVFLRFDGLLSEDMDFEPRRGWETKRIARRPPEGDGTFLIELLDSDGRALIQVKPLVEFYDGCYQESLTMRAAQVIAYIPYHPSAHRLLFRRDTYAIYEARVAKEPPQVLLNSFSTDGKSVSLSWEASHPEGFALMFDVMCAVDEGEAIIPLARELHEQAATLSLEQVPGGSGRLYVFAGDGLRSSIAMSESFDIENKPPQIWITSPLNGATYPPDQPISLIGHAVDILGNKLPEDELIWKIDSRTIQKGSAIAPAIGLKPGYHVASLSLQNGGDVATASTVNFSIAEYNDAQLRYRKLMRTES